MCIKQISLYVKQWVRRSLKTIVLKRTVLYPLRIVCLEKNTFFGVEKFSGKESISHIVAAVENSLLDPEMPAWLAGWMSGWSGGRWRDWDTTAADDDDDDYDDEDDDLLQLFLLITGAVDRLSVDGTDTTH